MVSKGNTPAHADDDNGNMTVTKLSPFQLMLRGMELDATADDGTVTGEDLNGILTAETTEDIWEADERGPLNFQHLAGCELAIIDLQVKFSRGSRDDIQTPFVAEVTGPAGQRQTKKMYLLVTAVRLSDAGNKPTIRLPEVGEVFEANTSAKYVATKLWAFYTKGLISPASGKTLECVVRETDLGDGTAVLKLRPMPNRSVKSTVTA